MILPTKHLSEDRALLWVGADILRLLIEPKTVSRLWDEFKRYRADRGLTSCISYDWFVLAMDFLFVIGAIEYEQGRIRRASR